MEIYLTRTPSGLNPANDIDLEKMKKVKMGDTVKVELTMPRNIRFHRKYFGLLSIVLDNMETPALLKTSNGQTIEVKTVEDLLWHIKFQLGHFEQKITLGGRVVFEPKSIAFHKMDETAFEAFYNGSIDVILKYFLDCKKEDLVEQVLLEFA